MPEDEGIGLDRKELICTTPYVVEGEKAGGSGGLQMIRREGAAPGSCLTRTQVSHCLAGIEAAWPLVFDSLPFFWLLNVLNTRPPDTRPPSPRGYLSGYERVMLRRIPCRTKTIEGREEGGQGRAWGEGDHILCFLSNVSSFFSVQFVSLCELVVCLSSFV